MGGGGAFASPRGGGGPLHGALLALGRHPNGAMAMSHIKSRKDTLPRPRSFEYTSRVPRAGQRTTFIPVEWTVSTPQGKVFKVMSVSLVRSQLCDRKNFDDVTVAAGWLGERVRVACICCGLASRWPEYDGLSIMACDILLAIKIVGYPWNRSFSGCVSSWRQ